MSKLLKMSIHVWFVWMFVLGITLFVDITRSLSCYKCIAIDCPHEPSICKSMENFVYREIINFYFIEDLLPECPSPEDDNPEWKLLESKRPTSIPCQGDTMKKEPTCILGRFQVSTLTTENNHNFTSHGSIMGCARPELLRRIKISKDETSGVTRSDGLTNPFDDTAERNPSIAIQKPCHSDKVQSLIENSLQHFMELEHCSISSDLCHNHDYCVMPKESVVKPFVSSSYNESKLGLATTIFMWTFIVLAVIIIALTFLGIKYDNS